MRDEHRHPRAVLALVKDLLGCVLVRIEVDLRAADERVLASDQVVAVDARRNRKAGKRIEGLGVRPLPAKAARRADPGQFDLADQLAAGREQLDLAAGVLQILHDEQVAHEAGRGEHVVGLRDQLSPMFPLRSAGVDGDQPPLGRAEIGLEEEDRPVVAHQRVLVVERFDQVDRHPVGLGEVLVDDAELVVGALPDRDHQVTSVLGHLGFEAPVGVVRPAVDEHIVGLRRAHAVIIDFLLRFRLWNSAPSAGAS